MTEYPNDNDEGQGAPTFIQPTANVAVFWRRVVAFLIDCLLLAFIGAILGLLFGDYFARLGYWGRLVGFVMAFAYFVPFDSIEGGGQTLGKKLMGVCVVDRDGHSISFGRSTARFLVIAAFGFLNGMYFDVDQSMLLRVLISLLTVIIFSLAIGLSYFPVFNRCTRQSLHDIICSTYVIRDDTRGYHVQGAVARLHYGVYAAAVICLTVFAFFGVSRMVDNAQLAGINDLMRSVNRLEGVRDSGVHITSYYFKDKTTRLIIVTLVMDRKPEKNPQLCRKALSNAAKLALRSDMRFDGVDQLVVETLYGYDLGIFKWTWRYNDVFPPNTWDKLREDT